MNDIAIIGLVFCLCFCVQSVFGFAGNILSVTILSFFFDIKEIIVLAVIVGGIASLLILLSDRKSFSWKLLLEILIPSVPGILIGVFFLRKYDSDFILQLFSIFLIVYALWTLMAPKTHIPNILKPLMNFVSGIFGGIFGGAGPFLIAAMREKFKNKSALRGTFAMLSIVFTVIRIPLYFQGNVSSIDNVVPFWWVIFPLIFCIWIGHRIHVKISERYFRIGISALLLVAGISFLM
jgi:uncharacterized membrane protein YfcA